MMNKDMIIKILLEANDVDKFTEEQCKDMQEKLRIRMMKINEDKIDQQIKKVMERCPEECKEIFENVEESWYNHLNNFGCFTIYYNDGNLLRIYERDIQFIVNSNIPSISDNCIKEKKARLENKGMLLRPIIAKTMNEIYRK